MRFSFTPRPPVRQVLKYHLAAAARKGGVYGMLLKGPVPEAPVRAVPYIWEGNAARGGDILSGTLLLSGHRAVLGDSPPWSLTNVPENWRKSAHGFEWLNDLVATGSTDIIQKIRFFVQSWLQENDKGASGRDPLIWDPAVTGRRLAAWLHFWPYLIQAGTDISEQCLISMGHQTRHLTYFAGMKGNGTERLEAIIGYVQATLILANFRPRLPEAIEAMERELSASILADGCHITRSPHLQFTVLKDLIALRSVFEEMREELPISLVTAIDRMAPVLRFFRHGDGGLVLFNDTREGDAESIDAVLGKSEAKGRPPARCPHGGFEKLTAGRLTAFADAGAAPNAPYDGHAHAGMLSIEISNGPERLIVNCGAPLHYSREWSYASRTTAAHSTLTLSDTNGSEVLPSGKLGKRRANTIVERQEAEGAVWLDMSHDGYEASFGVIHRRRLYLAAEGNDLRGEDQLIGPQDKTFTIRFHLHPSLQVSLLANHASALLKTPSGSGWRLRVSGAEISLTDSIYLGGVQETKRTQQILLTGVTKPDRTSIKWALKRETKR